MGNDSLTDMAVNVSEAEEEGFLIGSLFPVPATVVPNKAFWVTVNLAVYREDLGRDRPMVYDLQ
jgi:hypothetical protein